MKPELDESFAVYVFGELPGTQLVAHRVSQRCTASRRCLTFLRPDDLGAPRIQMEVERFPLVIAQRLVVEIAEDVARDIADHKPDDFLFDATLAVVERIPNCFVEGSRRETGSL